MILFSSFFKSLSILFFILFFLIVFPSSGQGWKQIEVTYIANSGYLIETKSAKVLIDAVFSECIGTYQCPDDSTIEKILNSQEPFNQLDYVIVTHHHPDHCNDSLMIKLMHFRDDFSLICPMEVSKELQRKITDPFMLKRIKSIDLDTGQTVSLQMEKIDFYLARSKHANTYEIENLCVIMQVDENHILHTGDIFPESIEDIDPAFFNEIDLAIVPISISSDRFKIHDSVLSPKYTILSHIKNDRINWLKGIMEKDSVTFKNKFVLSQPYDSKVFRFLNQ